MHPDVQIGTEAGLKAFEEVRATFEGLIARGIVAGKRLTGANGVYFDALKLTAKGERKAIETKNRVRCVLIQHIGPEKK